MAKKTREQEEPDYPKNETPWVRYYDKDGNFRYLTTSKKDRSIYYFYELSDGKFIRLGKGKNPAELFDSSGKL